jgi:hypothetical protein
MGLKGVFEKSVFLVHRAKVYLDRQEITELYRSGNRAVKKAALQKISRWLLSGKISLKTAHYLVPNDVLAAVGRSWGIKGELRNAELEELARTTESREFLTALAENPKVSLIAAKNPNCPFLAAAAALCRMPREEVYIGSVGERSDDPLDYNVGYFDKSLKHVRAVLSAQGLRRKEVVNYIRKHNSELYAAMGIHPYLRPMGGRWLR